ncbi:MAG: putative selenium-dependent hydroxylase accessory protein YqeC [Actinobacteria bacterium]|nr:putative selenium-dependent hydroxylase accessory protein YqeC [Actinomycetota bacterium]
MTTTTKMGRDRTGGYPVLFAPTDDELRTAVATHGAVLAWKADAAHKALGVEPETCDRWFDLVDHVVVEADGSRRHPFKAPRPYEPVVPAATTVLVACVGADALGRVIADQCQRPLRVAAVAGCSPYQRLTPGRLSRVLLSDRGSRKDCPDGARFAVLVNQVGERERPFVDELAECVGSAVPVVAVAPFAAEGGP